MSGSPGVLSGYEDRIEILTFHALAYRLLRAFGRYAGYGTATPSVQTSTRTKLLGHDESKLRYDDLIPGLFKIIQRSVHIQALLSRRWGLIVCDEAQDTSTMQWCLLQILASRRLLLLGDANQMIYTFLPGVSLRTFREIREWADQEIELRPRSHRDPSGAIPALARAIHQRQFRDDAVLAAVRSGRLAIHFDKHTGDVPALLACIIEAERRRGARDIGIFVHSNVAVAELADQLDAADINHVIVGIPEAHAEALASMATQCAFGLQLSTRQDVRESLGLFLTASVRSRNAPCLARALIGQAPLPDLIEEALRHLEDALAGATEGTMAGVAQVAVQSWESLLIQSGHRPWRRAAKHFQRLIGPFRQLPLSDDSVGSYWRLSSAVALRLLSISTTQNEVRSSS